MKNRLAILALTFGAVLLADEKVHTVVTTRTVAQKYATLAPDISDPLNALYAESKPFVDKIDAHRAVNGYATRPIEEGGLQLNAKQSRQLADKISALPAQEAADALLTHQKAFVFATQTLKYAYNEAYLFAEKMALGTYPLERIVAFQKFYDFAVNPDSTRGLNLDPKDAVDMSHKLFRNTHYLKVLGELRKFYAYARDPVSKSGLAMSPGEALNFAGHKTGFYASNETVTLTIK